MMAKRSFTPGPRDERGVLAARILAAARGEFAEHGWAGTTIRAVARAADVDPALVYHYFESKEGLLDAATTPPQRWLDNVAKTWTTPVRPMSGHSMISPTGCCWNGSTTAEPAGPTPPTRT
jgi:hypothetical protein